MSFTMPPLWQLDIGTRSSGVSPTVFCPPSSLPQLWPPGTLGIRIFGCWSHHSMLLLQGPGWHLRQKATKLRAELSRPFSLLSFPYWAKNCEFNWMMASVQLDQRSLQRKIFAHCAVERWTRQGLLEPFPLLFNHLWAELQRNSEYVPYGLWKFSCRKEPS